MRINKRDIKEIVERVIRKALEEGVQYTNSGNGTIDAKITTGLNDKDNFDIDTRIWGNKNDILNGDGSNNRKNSRSLLQQYEATKTIRTMYGYVIAALKNEGDIDINFFNNFPQSRSKAALLRKYKEYKEGYINKENFIQWAEITYERNSRSFDINQNKIDRIQNSKKEANFRYDRGIVPGTDVEFISLFRMNDFNFSDLIKNGELRQNDLTDKILNINPDSRLANDKLVGNGKATLKKIPATYDNGIAPDVANNFSLTDDMANFDDDGKLINNVDHFKKQYGYGDKNYTSITQFMNKSIIYAANVLKEINFAPNVIICPPSSSKYNRYYCVNLSRKLGITYIDNFFSRNITNIICDESAMRRYGMDEKDIFSFKEKVRYEIAKEISLIIAQPVLNLTKKYMNKFSNIKKGYNTRYDFVAIQKAVCQMSANALINTINEEDNDYLYKQICFRLKDINLGGGTIRNENSERIENDINKILHSHAIMGEYQYALKEMRNLIYKYMDRLMTENGIKLNIANKNFKITDFDKHERMFLNNVYMVADKNLNKNGDLLNSLKNSTFLIFDEDMNSGATLKLSIDALLDKLPNKNSSQIKCLVNCYSQYGR